MRVIKHLMAQPLLCVCILLIYLFKDRCQVPTPVSDVPVESSAQPDVRVGVHEDLHV